ncbi:NCS2 family permease [Endozoicomonas ascidiicola]|uniref:NCS2 family permease n=1 Tax=Endozoicomonas ascidiicola TaxID=1698521 RepID=UPI000A8C658A|nr:NCS2 family permease [Endozoicomonas ascidiicola]
MTTATLEASRHLVDSQCPPPEKTGWIERHFQLQANGTHLRQEVMAGITTFMTMAYIIFVNPQILSAAGMDAQAVFVTTCLIAAIGSIAMGVVANLPIAMAPAMGLNSYFAFVLVGGMGLAWQTGMAVIFWGSLLFAAAAVFRTYIITSIPLSLRIGIATGCGLMIALVGLHNAGIIVATPSTMVTIGDVRSIPFVLGCGSFLLMMVLVQRGFKAAVLISIMAITFIGWLLGDIEYQGIASLPPSVAPVFGQLDLMGALDISLAGVIISVMLVSLFESAGTFVAVTDKAGLADETGNYPNATKSLFIDSLSSAAGAFMGTSSVCPYVENATGVVEGGRTGLMAVVVGVLFLLAIFFSPLAGMIPGYATAGALIYVGLLMTSELTRVQWHDLTEAVPAFVATVMIPFSFTLTEGIATGFITYTVLKLASGRRKEVSPVCLLLTAVFIARYAFL